MLIHSNLLGSDFLEPLAPEISAAIYAADELSIERQELFRSAADAVAKQLREAGSADLIFICTHNSRRSQLGQVWAQVAATHFGLDRVRTYSGGTEATACNPRTISALQRAGIAVKQTSDGENPRYRLQFAAEHATIDLYSKRYADPANPQQNFVAMMCCDDADEVCPVVSGATARFRLSYVDPKRADDTPAEEATYDERSRQIAAEMFLLMGAVAKTR